MKKLWIDTRITEEEMNFLWQIISEENKEVVGHTLAGNISKSEEIKDKDNWFFESSLKELTERMFYRDREKEESPPEFKLAKLWVNYMKQHEFNPLHDHSGLYSFVIFMKIPTHWKEQHALPISANSNAPYASDFAFLHTEKNTEFITNTNFSLSPEDEGRMLFFPASLQHTVYPFYECEEERITVSGNIVLCDPDKSIHKIPHHATEYEEKENFLNAMKIGVQLLEEELAK